MYVVPAEIKSPAFMKEPDTLTGDGRILHGIPSYRVIDLSIGLALCRERKANKCGSIRRKIQFNGKKLQPELPVFQMKRASGSVLSLVGESAAMKPRSPLHGPISRSGYARKLDAFVAGNPRAVELFGEWRTRSAAGGVTSEDQREAHHGSILYFPFEDIETTKRNEKSRSVA